MPDFPENIESKMKELEYRVQSNPSPDVFAELADLYRTSENIDRAIIICKRGLEIFPDSHNCLLSYARILMDESKLDEAENILKKLVEISGEDVGILLLLGQLYTQHSNFAGVNSIAEKLAQNHSDDVRAKKFLKFLEAKGLLNGISIKENEDKEVSAEVQEDVFEKQLENEKGPLPTIPPKKKVKPKVHIPPQKQGPIIPIEDLMHITALLKGVIGVNHVILLTPDNRTLASKGCPDSVARSIGLLLRSFKKAMLVAFTALNFGKWKKGVMELNNATIHIMESNSHLFALVCDEKVSLGALRIAVNTILSKYFHI